MGNHGRIRIGLLCTQNEERHERYLRLHKADLGGGKSWLKITLPLAKRSSMNESKEENRAKGKNEDR